MNSRDLDRWIEENKLQRWCLLAKLANSTFDSLVKQVIEWVRDMTGRGMCFENPWEDFKYQIQEQHSPYFEVYEDTIRSFCVGIVAKLPQEVRGMLWLVLDADADEDGDWIDKETGRPTAIPFGYDVDTALATELYNRVCAVAGDEPLVHEVEEKDQSETEDESDDEN